MKSEKDKGREKRQMKKNARRKVKYRKQQLRQEE